MRSIALVPQRADWDCGIACLAMVTGNTYDRVVEWCGEKPTRFAWREKGMPTYDVPFMLAEMGFASLRKYGRHPNGWVDSQGLRIAAITLPSGEGHYVVRLADDAILDPSPNRSDDFARYAQPFHVWQIVEVTA